MKQSALLRDWMAYAVIAIAAAGALAVGVRHGTFAAADTDPYGYISEADAFASGRLQLDQRALQDVPWPNAEATFSPPGWRPAPTSGFIVPIYSPGLPVVMAVCQRVLGRRGVFYVVPVLAALAVLAIGWLGTILYGSFIGASSALLLATSPTMLRHVVRPVSDVPTMAWWTLSLGLASAGGSAAALGAGLSGSMAILTRPNLVPLAAIAGLLALLPRIDDPSGARAGIDRMIWFAAGLLPGCAAVGVINWMSTGSPVLSGYGSLGYLYSFTNVIPNLDRYPRWLWEQETPFVYLALLAPLVFRSRSGRRSSAPSGSVSVLLSFAAAVLLLYLPFSAFERDGWDYLRFMLPGIPVLIVLGMMVLVEGTRRLMPSGTRTARIVAPLVLLLAAHHVWWAAREGAFAAAIAEKRYPDVGRYVATVMPRDAVFVSGLHSGTIRYYANRVTIRYDQLSPDWLDRAISYMTAHGHPTYIVVEEGEEPIFKERFAAGNEFGKLDWPPSVERFEPIHVRIYDPADRARYMAGNPVVTGDSGLVGTPRITSRTRK